MVTAIGMEAITGDIARDTHFITVTTTGPMERAVAATVATEVTVEMPDGVGMADIEVDGKAHLPYRLSCLVEPWRRGARRERTSVGEYPMVLARPSTSLD